MGLNFEIFPGCRIKNTCLSMIQNTPQSSIPSPGQVHILFFLEISKNDFFASSEWLEKTQSGCSMNQPTWKTIFLWVALLLYLPGASDNSMSRGLTGDKLLKGIITFFWVTCDLRLYLFIIGWHIGVSVICFPCFPGSLRGEYVKTTIMEHTQDLVVSGKVFYIKLYICCNLPNRQ